MTVFAVGFPLAVLADATAFAILAALLSAAMLADSLRVAIFTLGLNLVV